MSQGPQPVSIDQRLRTLLVLWFAMFMSLVMWLVFIHLVPVEPVPNQRLSLILNTVILIPVSASFLVKQVLLGKAVATRQVQQVHSAYILAFALCEVAALLGLFDNRVTGSKYYYVGFAIGGLGILLHFPRRQYLVQASGQEF